MKLPNPAVRRSLALVGAAVIVAGPLAACGDDSSDKAAATTSTTATASSQPQVSDVWARSGTSGGNSAVYMTITGGKDADALTAAAVPGDVAAEAQVHETVMAGSTTTMGGSDMSTTTMGGSDMSTTTMGGADMMTMRQVDKVDVAAGGTVQFKPGGYHVMVLDLKKDLLAGDTVQVTLTFEKAGQQKVTATVRDS